MPGQVSDYDLEQLHAFRKVFLGSLELFLQRGEESFCPDSLAETLEGHKTRPQALDAVRWCLLGACNKILYPYTGVVELYRFMADVFAKPFFSPGTYKECLEQLTELLATVDTMLEDRGDKW